MSMMFSREIQYSALTYAVIQFAGLAYMMLSPIDRLQVIIYLYTIYQSRCSL